MNKRLWTTQEEAYLKKWYNVKTITEIAKILHRSYNSVQRKAQSMNLCDSSKKIQGKEWTDEEIEYLEAYYNKRSVAFIAKKFHRTKESVKRKAQNLGLNAYVGDELYVKQIARCFNCDSLVINRWIDKYGLSCRETQRGDAVFKSIDVKTFWKWAESHKDLIRYLQYEEYSLLPEPSWLKDFYKGVTIKKHRVKVTNDERNQIKFLREVKKYKWKDIANELHRTIDSVKHIYYEDKRC